MIAPAALRRLALMACGLAAAIALSGCGSPDVDGKGPIAGDDGQVSAAPAETITLPGDDVVLVTVQGEPISEYDLALAMDTILGPTQAALLDEKGQRKMLDSLVLSRLMANALEAGLTPDELAEVDKQTRAYREQLLAKRYLKEYADPQPVTEAMVTDYYERHPERFGGKSLRRYELLMEAEPGVIGEREKLLQRLSAAGGADDWKAYAAQADAASAVQFRSGQVDENLLHPQLLALLAPLQVGQSSEVTFIEGRAYIVRITEEREREPRPLADVSAEIRRMLAPVQLKLAIQEVSDALLKDARIEYPGRATTKEQTDMTGR